MGQASKESLWGLGDSDEFSQAPSHHTPRLLFVQGKSNSHTGSAVFKSCSNNLGIMLPKRCRVGASFSETT